MDSNHKPLMKILYGMVVFFIIGITYQSSKPVEESATAGWKPFCNPKLYQSLGFIGHKWPKKMFLDMCPTVTMSCCKLNDQLSIFKSWVGGQEEENLEKRLGGHKEIYKELLETTILAMNRAKKTFELVEERAVSNCKILARRILAYRVDAIKPLIMESLEQMHDFLSVSHKGLYCSVCDATKTKYFKIFRRKFVFGEEFCRNIVNNSLVVLLYFHHHFNKYLNLVGKFVNQCDYLGDFKRKRFPPTLLFHSKARDSKVLSNCNRYKNEVQWFDFCKPICKKFNWVEFNDFFKPNIDNFRKYNRWLNRHLQKIDLAEEKDRMIKGRRQYIRKRKQKKLQKMLEKGLDISEIENASKARILSEKSKSKTKSSNKDESSMENDKDKDSEDEDNKDKAKKKDKEDKMLEEQQRFEEKLSDAVREREPPTIFRSVASSNIEYGAYKSTFKLEGLNPYNVGKVSLFTDHIYDSVERAIKLQRKSFFSKNEDSDEYDSASIQLIGMLGLLITILIK